MKRIMLKTFPETTKLWAEIFLGGITPEEEYDIEPDPSVLGKI
jgi:hypothetical protein